MRSYQGGSRRALARALTAAVSAAAVVGLPALASAASVAHNSVVSADPANYTPHVLDDAAVANSTVYAFHQIGSTMYAGGHFNKVQNPSGGATFTRHNLVAFNATTGAVLSSFAPRFDGPVWAIESSGSALYVGGDFKNVNGEPHPGLVKLDSAGAVVESFVPPITYGKVRDLRMVDGRLIVGSTQARRQLMALNPTTGTNTKYISPQLISGSVASNAGPTEVYRFAVNSDGTRLVAIGNFTTVGGETHKRAFMLNLGDSVASVNPWRYPPLDNACRAASLPDQLRGVDFSPDGSYFVLVATGYIPVSGGLHRDICDAAARFNTNVANPTRPEWINYTGGDTLHSVAVTGAAVYVQGHQRWLDNPNGVDSAGTGSVPRPGIGAINPVTGKALDWNPTKTRGVGGKVLYATPAGLWVGSDGTYIGKPRELRPGIAFMPLP